MQLPPPSLRSLSLGEASCHAMRPLKHPCREVHIERNCIPPQPSALTRQPHEGAPGSRSSSHSLHFRWLQPQLIADYASMETSSQDQPVKLLSNSTPRETMKDDKRFLLLRCCLRMICYAMRANKMHLVFSFILFFRVCLSICSCES